VRLKVQNSRQGKALEERGVKKNFGGCSSNMGQRDNPEGRGDSKMGNNQEGRDSGRGDRERWVSGC